MQAGQLIEKVSFKSPAASNDGYGGTTDGWVDRFTDRAQFIYAGGGESLQAARLEGRSVMKVKIRSHTQSRMITQDWMMVDERRGAIYNIREIDAETDRAWIYMLVERGVAP